MDNLGARAHAWSDVQTLPTRTAHYRTSSMATWRWQTGSNSGVIMHMTCRRDALVTLFMMCDGSRVKNADYNFIIWTKAGWRL